MLELLRLAGKIALPNEPECDLRNFWLGCVGIRNDGVKVFAKNSPVYSTTVDNYRLLPNAHAEGRVLRKLGKGGELYVARISKLNGQFAMSMPCPMCQVRIKAFDVKRVFYTLNESQYCIWDVKKNTHRAFNV